MRHPVSLGVAAEYVDAAALRLDPDIPPQRVELPVVRELGGAVEGGGGVGKDLDYRGRAALERVLPAVGRGTGDEDVGGAEGIRRLDTHLPVRDRDPAGAAADVGAKQGEHIAGDGDAGLAGPRHGEDLTGDVLVPDGG
jgi:hypothetical protein